MVAATKLLAELDALTADEAEGWVAAALAEARALHQYDDRLYPYGDDEALMRRARRFHEAWQEWCDAAAGLVERARQLGVHVPGLHDLRHELALRRGILSMTPDEFRRRALRAVNGETPLHSPSELRREVADSRLKEQGRGMDLPRHR